MFIQSQEFKYKFKAFALSVGYFISYSALAICRELIFKKDYDGENFVYPISLVLIQCISNVFAAKAVQVLKKDEEKNVTPQKFYATVSIFNILALIATNMSLVYIPFILLVIGKSCKPIPVMVFTAIIARKYYTPQRYLFVTVIAFGVGLFIYKDGAAYSSDSDLIGKVLILTCLVLEGFMGSAQALMRNVAKPSSLNYMVYVNFWCAIFCLPMLLINYEILGFLPFCIKHKETVLYVTLVTSTGIVSHYFCSAMISNYGPLHVAIVSTTRKFFTILCSSLLFGNPLSFRQWSATAIIFAGLFFDSIYGKAKPLKKDPEKVSDVEESGKAGKGQADLEVVQTETVHKRL